MITSLTKQDLINFEKDIATCFNKGKIRAPIHLYDGCEEQMLDIFQEINPEDWICTTWRSHYQCALKGVPLDILKQDILKGHSISLCYKDYNIISSAIVAGILPIALGLAIDIKRKNLPNKVWCWLGEMTSCHGQFQECLRYAQNWQLPITYIIENNGKSVCTDTYKVWNTLSLPHEPIYKENKVIRISSNLYYYWYKLDKWPHAGAGQRVQF